MQTRAQEVRRALDARLRAYAGCEGARVYHTPPLVFHRRDDGLGLVLDPEGPCWLSTNDVGAEVLRLTDGRRSVDEITALVRERFPEAAREADGELAGALCAFLDEVVAVGMASLSPFARPAYLGRAEAVAPGRLAELYVFVTNDCNLRCTHCYVSSGDYVPPDELGTEEMLRLIDEARDLGVARFYFTGGEPFMRKDIFELVDHVCAASELVILTNATTFNAPLLAKLAAAAERANGRPGEGAPRRLHFQVSLDGPDAATHEAVRGARTFERTLHGIRELVALGLVPAVSTSLTVHVIDRLAEVTSLLRTLGVKEHHLHWLQDRGRAYDNQGLGLPPSRVTEARRETSAVAASLGMVIDNEASHRVRVRGKRGRKTDLCNCGYESLGIFSDGRVYPCVWLAGAPSLDCGSIRQSSLRDIWLASPVLQALRETSVQNREGCSECHLKFLCGGGTGCSAWLNSLATEGRGSFQAAEPYCETYMDMTYDLLWQEATPEHPSTSALPKIHRSMEGEGAECARPYTRALDRSVEVGSFHCSCVLQADVDEGKRVRAFARTQAERAGDLGAPHAAAPDLTNRPAGAGTERIASVNPKKRLQVAPARPPQPEAAPEGATTPAFDDVFDGMGQSCVDLLLPLAKTVKGLEKGCVLKVVTDDVAAHEDLGAWCRMTGHELLSIVKHPTYWSYFVRRGP